MLSLVSLVAALAACGGSDGDGGGGTNPTPTAPKTVTITPSPISVFVGDSVQLTAVVRDSNNNILANSTVTWGTGNGSTASVTAGGRIKGLAAGTTQVTASATPAAGQAGVTVSTKPAGNSFHPNLSTYLGGNDIELARDVTVDAQGNVIVAGNTYSDNFPVTPGAYDVTHATGFDPPADAFIVKISPGGSVVASTFLGGPNYERIYGVETDAQGFIYLSGRAGASFPVTNGAFQTTFGGGSTANFYGPQDAMVCKMQPDLSARVWCSYFGVSDDGISRDMTVDAQGNVYLVAWTTVGGFPSAWFTNAYQPTKHAGEEVIVAKIKADGSQVLWATYLGGSGDDGGTPAIRLDANGNVLVLFMTNSTDLATPGNGDHSLNGGLDQFLAKLSADGSQLLYGTYVGGGGNETSETHGLAVDGTGNAFVAVATTSNNLTFPGGNYQAQYGGGTGDGVLWKIGPTGTILAGTYYGGTGSEGIQGVSADANGDVYFSATTSSATIATTVAGGGNPNGNGDAVAVKMSGTLGSLLFAQRFGGSDDETSRASWIGSNGAFVIVGQTTSTNFPLVNALQPQPGGGGFDDAWLIRLIP
ncbi:MAG: SBBP repeat-containing protein [Gemmatimonadetes bacterium]|nr:SBBP repeat-containing protein [Gemmatimonadota bacterium]